MINLIRGFSILLIFLKTPQLLCNLYIKLDLFIFDCIAQLAASQPRVEQGLNPGRGSESPESLPLGHQGKPNLL